MHLFELNPRHPIIIAESYSFRELFDIYKPILTPWINVNWFLSFNDKIKRGGISQIL